MLKGLYVISDDVLTPNSTLYEDIKKALIGGAKVVQLRDKVSSDEEIEEKVKQIQALCDYYNATFILNDRIDLAIKLQCHGLHIGKSDHKDFKEIRKKFKGIIGVSCYGNLKLAKTMQDDGANYVAFGSFFNSITKPNSKLVPVDLIKKAKEELEIPVCVIGGINTNSVKTLMQFNPDMVSVINDIWSNKELVVNKAAYYTSLFK
ncbi:thiamine phosphate synthase [Arcobacter sp. YIC-464]|uniref:thiamine phosphate synthase n=1 Tax=Arcobacter sp. YIC-464 TaxID=3376631 RepID=UPI003C149EC3